MCFRWDKNSIRITWAHQSPVHMPIMQASCTCRAPTSICRLSFFIYRRHRSAMMMTTTATSIFECIVAEEWTRRALLFEKKRITCCCYFSTLFPHSSMAGSQTHFETLCFSLSSARNPTTSCAFTLQLKVARVGVCARVYKNDRVDTRQRRPLRH